MSPDQPGEHRILLDACVACGLCLSSCPTYVVRPLEQFGPRGRITGMKLHADGLVGLDDPDYVESMETCVQCRACEDVCPSGVQFGALMEHARAELAADGDSSAVGSAVEGVAFRALRTRPLLRAASAGLAALQAVRADALLPDRLRMPRRSWLRDGLRKLRPAPANPPPDARAVPVSPPPDARAVPVSPPPDAPTAGDAPLLFRGCVMDQWFRPVHQDAIDLLGRAGQDLDPTRRGACCGALSLHAGRQGEAKTLAAEVVAAHADTTGPVVIDSGGCGAAMREYGRLLGTPEAQAFAERVVDVTEAVTPEDLPPMALPPTRVGYLPSCHLRHVQKVVAEPLALLGAVEGLEVVVPPDLPRCCGAGGAFSVLQPELSGAVGHRMAEAFRRAGVSHIVSGNPGCIIQLEGLGFTVEHTASILARACAHAAESA